LLGTLIFRTSKKWFMKQFGIWTYFARFHFKKSTRFLNFSFLKEKQNRLDIKIDLRYSPVFFFRSFSLRKIDLSFSIQWFFSCRFVSRRFFSAEVKSENLYFNYLSRKKVLRSNVVYGMFYSGFMTVIFNIWDKFVASWEWISTPRPLI
jgi:hypothetical protein